MVPKRDTTGEGHASARVPRQLTTDTSMGWRPAALRTGAPRRVARAHDVVFAHDDRARVAPTGVTFVQRDDAGAHRLTSCAARRHFRQAVTDARVALDEMDRRLTDD